MVVANGRFGPFFGPFFGRKIMLLNRHPGLRFNSIFPVSGDFSVHYLKVINEIPPRMGHYADYGER